MASCFALTQQETHEFIKAAGFSDGETPLPATMRPTTRPIEVYQTLAVLSLLIIENFVKRSRFENISAISMENNPELICLFRKTVVLQK